jgi:hypothetical protein
MGKRANGTKKKFVFIALILILLLIVVLAHASERTYQGKVIDAETKEPIEGAVVVARWWEEKGAFLGSVERLRDVKETLTDRDGKWSITGPESDKRKIVRGMLSIIAIVWAIRDPGFIIFKPGYCSWPIGFSIDACKDKIGPERTDQIMEGKTVEFEFPRLTNREDRLKVLPETISSSSEGPREYKKIQKKQMEFLRLINEERRNLGLTEYKIYEELKNEK